MTRHNWLLKLVYQYCNSNFASSTCFFFWPWCQPSSTLRCNIMLESFSLNPNTLFVFNNLSLHIDILTHLDFPFHTDTTRSRIKSSGFSSISPQTSAFHSAVLLCTALFLSSNPLSRPLRQATLPVLQCHLLKWSEFFSSSFAFTHSDAFRPLFKISAILLFSL